MYIDKSIKEYLRVVQSGDPTPGGGSVCSLVSSLGAALTLMTSNLSFDKEYFNELDLSIQEKMENSHKNIEESIGKMNNFIDEDAEGFANVIEELNKENNRSEEEKKEKLEASYKKALETPLKCSRECLEILRNQQTIVEHGNDDTITDVGVGVILVYAALEGCVISVKINLKAIDDSDYVEKIEKEINNIYKKSSGIKNSLLEEVDKIVEP